MKKVRKAVKVAYGVSDNDAREMAGMFINMRKAA
jgi:hypothetical protein